ncbi:VWA domain-containing protein [Labrys sp. KNU-23]|nr:VWA domain-containing protein [Labrys sp. KNU-23]
MMAFEARQSRRGPAPKWWQGLGLARLSVRPSLRMALVTGAALLVVVPIGTYMLKRQEALLHQGGTDVEAITKVQTERPGGPDGSQNVAQQAPATSIAPAQEKTVLAKPMAAPPPGPNAAQDTRMIGGYSAEYRYEASDAFGPRASQEIGRDKFANAPQNGFKAVAQEPVSTFSLDVDTASYSYVRAALNQNLLPRPEAVRTEEMINYFPYDYASPASAEEPFSTVATLMPNPWLEGHKLLRIGVKGYSLQAQERPAANLVFLIDTSGSMNEASKLPLLVKSLGMLVDTLRPEDKVSIVTYAGSAGVVLPPTKAGDKAAILAAFDRLQAGGSTDGGEGIRLAYQQAEANFDPKAVNRVLLATDGDFNVGITDPGELRGFVERERGKGIFLSVLGFGMGNLNDQMMQELAQNGNGVAAYIDTLNEARKVLVEEATSSLFPIAKDVKIQVEFNPAAVSDYRLIGYETRMLKTEDFNNDKVDAGDVGSGATVTAIYDVVPAGAARPVDGSRYQAAPPTPPADKADEYAFVKIRYKLPKSETSRLISTPVTQAGEAATVAQAPTDARFAVAVAGFGEWLRGGKYAGTLKPDDIVALAAGAKGDDPYGYRAEFVNLVRAAKTAKGLPQQP